MNAAAGHLLAPAAARLHHVAATESDAMRGLFLHVFRHEMTPELWHWKYGGGRGHGVALSRGGRMLAHYGGTTRRVRWNGRPADACQACDVMVAPEANAALVRRGPMHQVAAAFLESQCGWGTAHPLGYGFPSHRHYMLGLRLGLYDAVDSIRCLSWPARALPTAGWTAEPLSDADLAPGGCRRAAVDGLWEQMAARLRDRVVGVRDAEWLRWRYLHRPGARYELHCVARGAAHEPAGVVVTRDRGGHLDVLDLVGPPQAFGPLIAQARAHAAALGKARVQCWISASQQGLLASIDAGELVDEPTGITVPANTHTPGPVHELRERWFLLAGDADFT